MAPSIEVLTKEPRADNPIHSRFYYDYFGTATDKVLQSIKALGEIWFPRPEPELERYLRRQTRNPYIARTLVALALKNGSSQLPYQEAIERIERNGIDGVVEAANETNLATAWGGGVGRALDHVGGFRAHRELGLRPKTNAGTSAGDFVAYFSDENTYRNGNGIDYSPDALESFAFELIESLGTRNLLAAPNSLAGKMAKKFSETVTATRGFVKEGFIPIDGVKDFLQKKIGPVLMESTQGFHAVAAAYDCDGNNRVVYSSKTAPKKPVVDVFMESIALPTLFDPVRTNGHIMGDGGLIEAVPLGAAMIEGHADIVIGVALNYRIPKGKPTFYGPTGKISQGDRNFAIMQRPTTYWMTKYLTGESPGHVSRWGDKYGRVMLRLVDLANVAPFDLYEGAPKLIKPGRENTLDFLAKFLSPRFAHEQYDPEYFIQLLPRQQRTTVLEKYYTRLYIQATNLAMLAARAT